MVALDDIIATIITITAKRKLNRIDMENEVAAETANNRTNQAPQH